MYYQNYEDYMRSVLGYPTNPTSNIYETNNYILPFYNSTYSNSNINYARLYPEIYKITQPLVSNVVKNVSMPITEEWLEEATNDIYNNLKKNDKIVSAFNLKTLETKNRDNKNSTTIQEENRMRSNLLADFIKILILNQILNGQQRPPRPHYPGENGPVIPPRPMPRDFI